MSKLNTQGFEIFRETDLDSLISMPDDYKLLNNEERLRDNGEKDLCEQLSGRFKLAGQYLQYKYLEPIWPGSQFKKFIVWEGVDYDNQLWHTDAFEDMDVFFLYYFDDTHEESGGAINFKWDQNSIKYQPKKCDLIMVSNKRGFFHKADPTTIRRRVASFDFKLSGKL